MITDILKSKYVQRFLAAAAAIAVCIYFLVSSYSSDLSIPSEEIYKALEGKAEILIDFPEKHQTIEIVNGEKGYFAVKENGAYIIIDKNGRKLLDTEVGAWEEPQYAGDYFLTCGSMHTALVHKDTLQMQTYELENASIHSSGRYLLGEWDGWKVIDTGSGNVIYESHHELVWPQKEGYVIEFAAEEPHRIINLQTGKAEFEAEKDQLVADGNDDFWLLSEGTCRFALDADYQFHDDWPLFREASLGDGVVIGAAIEDATAADLKEYCEDGMYVVPDIRAFNGNGEEVYWLNSINIRYLGCVGSTMVTQNTKGGTFSYRTVGPEGVIFERITKYYSYFPSDERTEDKYVLAYKPAIGDLEPMKASAEPDMERARGYRWTYLNENLEPVMDFVFHGASMADNGYAVVYNEDGYAALIDLEQRGGK